MARNRKKEVKMKKILIVVWLVFIIALGSFGFLLYKNRDVVQEDLKVTTRFSYETNSNLDINALIITYLSAKASCDQEVLKSCVTDPSQFDNMSYIVSQSKIITAYNGIDCFSVPGPDENSTIVYAIAKISIINVTATPQDMQGPFYVVKKDGQYLIDNTMLSEDVQNYIDKVNRDADIQDLYKSVLKDQEKCAAEDPAFQEFLNRLP